MKVRAVIEISEDGDNWFKLNFGQPVHFNNKSHYFNISDNTLKIDLKCKYTNSLEFESKRITELFNAKYLIGIKDKSMTVNFKGEYIPIVIRWFAYDNFHTSVIIFIDRNISNVSHEILYSKSLI